MGNLDEAIRQHLDLKRRHGAEDSEVKKLEDEAFGPPTRPGEPDFPESQEHSVVPAEGDEQAPELEPASFERPAVEAADAPEQDAPEAPPGPAVPEPAAEAPPAEAEAAPALASEAAEPAVEEPAGFYDHAAVEEDELEDSADDLLEEGEPADAPLASEEHPITSMETVEHPMEELLAADVAEAPATDEEPLPEGPITGEEESLEDDSDDSDVLEETPEFLREQPEDDELWFEQGEPKDFDFD